MLAYAVVYCLVKVISALPLRWALAFGRAIGWIACSVLRLRRRVVLTNLKHVFGDERSPAELKAIAAEAYGQCSMMFVEVMRASNPGSSGLGARVEYDPLDRFQELKASGSPLIIMQPHLGNFDFTAYAFAIQGFPLHTVMKKVHNRRINDLLIGAREQHDITVIVKSKDTYPQLIELLRGGGWLGVLPDQRPRRGKGVEVDFLGKPARIYPGPALLHLETGAPLCLGWGVRQADPCQHHVHNLHFPPYTPTGDRAADVKAIMQMVADAMGEAIRASPAQYFWFHRLWGKELSA